MTTKPTSETDAEMDAQVLKLKSRGNWHGEIEVVGADFARKLKRERDEALKWQEPRLARNQPCGCIICNCEDDEKCSGCGAKHCGTHEVGKIPNPVYENHHTCV